MAWILVRSGNRGRLVEVAGESFGFGRGEENDLVLPSAAVSGKHGMIVRQPDGTYKIVDLNSRNGTRLNGRRVEGSAALKNGDEVTAGDVEMVFYEDLPELPVLEGGIGGKEEKVVLLRKPLRIGRLDSNDLVLPHPGVSNFHARMEYENGRYRIQDLGSTNGTRVNGKVVASTFLNDGDVVEIGPYRWKFRHLRGSKGDASAAVAAADASAPTPKEGLPAVREKEESIAPKASVAKRQPLADKVPLAKVTVQKGEKLVYASLVLAGMAVIFVLVEAAISRSMYEQRVGRPQRLNLLLADPSFEKSAAEGALVGWNARTDKYTIVKIEKGYGFAASLSSLVMEPSGRPPATSVAGIMSSERIPVRDGMAYEGTVYVSGGGETGGGYVVAGLQWLNLKTGAVAGEDYSRPWRGGKGWARLAVRGLPPVGADAVRLILLKRGDVGRVWVDECGVYELPSSKAGTLTYELPVGSSVLRFNRKGLVYLYTGDEPLLWNGELVLFIPPESLRQNLIVPKGAPSTVGGFSLKGGMVSLLRGKEVAFSQSVGGDGAGWVKISYSLSCPEGLSPSVVKIGFLVPPAVVEERRLKWKDGKGGGGFCTPGFSAEGVTGIVVEKKKDGGVEVSPGVFKRVEMKDARGRGYMLIFSAPVGQEQRVIDVAIRLRNLPGGE